MYVIADDENHLGIFDAAAAPGRLHRLLPGDLPRPAAARKRRKADLEALVLLPPGRAGPGAALLALGSGSGSGSGSALMARRERALLQPLDARGGLAGPARCFDLGALCADLRARLGALNIEGVACRGNELALFNRGGGGRRGANVLVRYRLDEWLQSVLTHGPARRARVPKPQALHECRLGQINGIGYGFTDAAPWPARAGGGWLFSAVAEASDDSISDGACVGSALGHLDRRGRVSWLRVLRGHPKVEGVALAASRGGIDVCLVTDADDPGEASALLRLHLPLARAPVALARAPIALSRAPIALSRAPIALSRAPIGVAGVARTGS